MLHPPKLCICGFHRVETSLYRRDCVGEMCRRDVWERCVLVYIVVTVPCNWFIVAYQQAIMCVFYVCFLRVFFTCVFYVCFLCVFFTCVFYVCFLRVFFMCVFYVCFLRVFFMCVFYVCFLCPVGVLPVCRNFGMSPI